MDTVTKPVPSTVDTLWDALDVARYCKTSRSWVRDCREMRAAIEYPDGPAWETVD
jgi:hypothetical protein